MKLIREITKYLLLTTEILIWAWFFIGIVFANMFYAESIYIPGIFTVILAIQIYLMIKKRKLWKLFMGIYYSGVSIFFYLLLTLPFNFTGFG